MFSILLSRMYRSGNMDIGQIHVGKTANIYILQFNDFLSNIFNLSLIDMKTAAISQNTGRGHLTLKVKKTDPLKFKFQGGSVFYSFIVRFFLKHFRRSRLLSCLTGWICFGSQRDGVLDPVEWCFGSTLCSWSHWPRQDFMFFCVKILIIFGMNWFIDILIFIRLGELPNLLVKWSGFLFI